MWITRERYYVEYVLILPSADPYTGGCCWSLNNDCCCCPRRGGRTCRAVHVVCRLGADAATARTRATDEVPLEGGACTAQRAADARERVRVRVDGQAAPATAQTRCGRVGRCRARSPRTRDKVVGIARGHVGVLTVRIREVRRVSLGRRRRRVRVHRIAVPTIWTGRREQARGEDGRVSGLHLTGTQREGVTRLLFGL